MKETVRGSCCDMSYLQLVTVDYLTTVAIPTPSYTTDAILVEQCMPCAIPVLYSETDCTDSVNPSKQTAIMPLSMSLLLCDSFRLDPLLPSDTKEQRVFSALLSMVPGLKARLLASSDDEVRLIADLVRHLHPETPLSP